MVSPENPDPQLAPAPSPDPADWVIGGIEGFASGVGSVVPDGFAAYARIFHPALRHEGVEGGGREVGWAAVATANGMILHAEAQFRALVGESRHDEGAQPGLWDELPMEGSLPPRLSGQLVDVLCRHTATPSRCWFAVWDGYGCSPSDTRTVPTFDLPDRRYLLLTGTAAGGANSVCDPPLTQSPNLWWPEDHAWFLATEIDFNSTYIGGSSECIKEIVANPGFEALPVNVTDGITWESDHLNLRPTAGTDRQL